MGFLDKIYTTGEMPLMTKDVNNFLGTNMELNKKINVSKKEVMPTEEEVQQFLDGIYWDKAFFKLVKEKGPDVKAILSADSFFDLDLFKI